MASSHELKAKKDQLSAGSMRVPPGAVGFGSLTCAWLADSSPLEVPLIGVNGAFEGPKLWVNSTMHGPEIPGIEVIRRFVREEVDPRQLHGSILAAPIASPLAYRAATYFTPVDGINMARVFGGGSYLPSITHRIGHCLYQLIQTCDCVIDLHANPTPAMIFTIVPQGEGDAIEESLDLAECFGVTTIRDVVDRSSLTDNVISDGKPSLILELTSWQHIDDDAVAIGVEGLLNVCSRLGMLNRPQEHVECKRTPVVSGRLGRLEVFSDRGGLVSVTKSAGDEVHAGELLGLIRNPYGDVEEEIVCPVDGWLLAYPIEQNQSAFTGETVVYLAVPMD